MPSGEGVCHLPPQPAGRGGAGPRWVSAHLRPGGLFLGILVDGDAVRRRLEGAPPGAHRPKVASATVCCLHHPSFFGMDGMDCGKASRRGGRTLDPLELKGARRNPPPPSSLSTMRASPPPVHAPPTDQHPSPPPCFVMVTVACRVVAVAMGPGASLGVHRWPASPVGGRPRTHGPGRRPLWTPVRSTHVCVRLFSMAPFSGFLLPNVGTDILEKNSNEIMLWSPCTHVAPVFLVLYSVGHPSLREGGGGEASSATIGAPTFITNFWRFFTRHPFISNPYL